MKNKFFLVIILVVIVILSLYAYSFARRKTPLPKPEDMAGKEASAFMPDKAQDKPVSQGSKDLKVSGPVWVGE
ncbi:MAG: hypothetical protein PHO70_04780 [Candidatus Omnitrophica bacterium]|nr:hypothetical protein [Candidatus Omnitrophota bacterium]